MKLGLLPIASLLALYCASCRATSPLPETAPYKAVVVFTWLADEVSVLPGQPESVESLAQDDQTSRAGIVLDRRFAEDEFVRGLDEYGVFSDFVIADWKDMYAVAELHKADLIVLVRIGSVADWSSHETRIDPGLAVLDGFLWFGTAIGGWFVPSRIYPTRSDIEVSWIRPKASDGMEITDPPVPRTIAEIRPIFRDGDRLTSGEYKLSFWQRARIWTSPGSYLANIFVPSSLSPFQDDDEVKRSLELAALEDLKRELAQKLDRSSLRSVGAPFAFRLEEPRNGSQVDGPRTTLRYSYRPVPGFEEHVVTKFSGLEIEILRDGETEYRTVASYKDVAIREINRRIDENRPIEETVDGLGPGLNLIRFAAKLARTDLWITNTVALRGS